MMTETAVEWTSETILKELLTHLREQRPVALYNTYQGIPITYEAEVAMVHPEYAGLIAHPYQTVCIKNERRTYLKCKAIPELIRAYPVSIDYTNNVVLLKRLKVPRVIPVDLFNAWVVPERSVAVELDSDLGARLEGELLALAVLTQNVVRAVVSVPEDVAYVRQDAIDLTFRLPAGDELIQVSGVVRSLTKQRKQQQKRLEVEGKATMQDEIAILAYIARQEDAIMRNLDKEYQKLRRGKKHGK